MGGILLATALFPSPLGKVIRIDNNFTRGAQSILSWLRFLKLRLKRYTLTIVGTLNDYTALTCFNNKSEKLLLADEIASLCHVSDTYQ